MQRKGNVITRESQGTKMVTVGVDMGGALWATWIHDWSTGRDSYHGYRDQDVANGKSKEELLYAKVAELVGSGHDVRVFYEAGRYGYTPARIMKGLGAEVTILPINKLKVIMCGKTIKTDKLDAKFLGGLHPSDNLPAVHIPTPAEEDRRDAEREIARLREGVNRANGQMLAIVERTALGRVGGYRSSAGWNAWVDERSKSGALQKLEPFMALRLKNMVEELTLFEKHLKQWRELIDKRMAKDREDAAAGQLPATFDSLLKFKGIGETIARHLVWEVGDFGRFKNGKQFASYFGLTPCPFASGTMNRDQGISKTGRKSLRKMAVEMAWLWRRWQPDSRLAKKWEPMLAQKGRARKTAVVALARQLLVALWRHVMLGEDIEGAITAMGK